MFSLRSKVNLLRRRFLASSERQNQVQSRRFGTKIKFKQKSLNQKINQKIIEENFMTGYRRISKPKSEYNSDKRKALTIQEEKILVDCI